MALKRKDQWRREEEPAQIPLEVHHWILLCDGEVKHEVS